MLQCARLALVLCGLAWAPAEGAEAGFEGGARPVLAKYCAGCHSAEKHKGDLDLERFGSETAAAREPKVWEQVAEQLKLGEMPPKEKAQPSPGEREVLLGWIEGLMERLALERDGDPGPVVLRRLSNAEYTYTVRDLTGVEALDPAREFPVDGAAGEGFMNTGSALVMSPALISKYLEAGKGIASHAMLLPDGIRFSGAQTRRDRTEEILGRIRGFYRKFTDPTGGETVNLQGIVFETNEGGRLPLEKYLAAAFAARAGGQSLDAVARERGLSGKYLAILWKALHSEEPSLLLDGIRARWKGGKEADAAALAAEIAPFQKALWKFSSVGHIGKAGGPKGWMEPADPLTDREETRLKLVAPAGGGDITVYFAASDAGDGNEHDFVTWREPALEAAGRPRLLLRDAVAAAAALARRREAILKGTERALEAAAEARGTAGPLEMAALAEKHGLERPVLEAWLDWLGIASSGELKIEGHFTDRMTNMSGQAFVNGWGRAETPLLAANSSEQEAHIPGLLKAHGVAVHPSPALRAAVGWRSPVQGVARVEARVTHAHPACGNGVTWTLEVRRGGTRQRLAAGTAQGSREVKAGAVASVRPGDLISLSIGPRDGNHACDLTAVDLEIAAADQKWNLAEEISGSVLEGNPHADRFGNAAVWHFYAEPDQAGAESAPGVPSGSMLAQWLESDEPGEQQAVAAALAEMLRGPKPPAAGPGAELYRELRRLRGPLLRGEWARLAAAGWPASSGAALDPGSVVFGRRPDGGTIAPGSLGAQAPAVVEVRIPAELAEGAELVTTGVVEGEGSVQLEVSTNKPALSRGLAASPAVVTDAGGLWTSNNQRVSHRNPIVVNPGSQARARIEREFEAFRQLFPAALCYPKIVPVDEVVTLTLYYREDHHLRRLMLGEKEAAELDRLWSELHYVSQDALTLVDAFEQLWQFATQDADPSAFEPLRQPIQEGAAAFRRQLSETAPRHVQAVVEFAGRAYRRPLDDGEREGLRKLYRDLRGEGLAHDEAIRLMLARVLVAPAFLYKLEKAAPGTKAAPVTPWELASRLSYFLWSSLPDEELARAAASGRLGEPDELAAQARRMLGDGRVRRLAIEFGCQWLNVHGFDSLDEKSERHFPEFAKLRGPMYEESIRFFQDLFQRDGTVLEILSGDFAYLTEELAKHYGIPGVAGPEWRRVEGMKRFGRGGVLGQGATLARQSGASRTSPILRGNWVAEALLGDKLPRPPKDVPQLPEEEGSGGLTVRQLTERHSSDPRCAGCHVRIDPFGYALERFDAIGRRRDQELTGGAIDTRAKTMEGARFDGLEGLRDYLLTQRRDAFVHQFCRKLLGYALGRGVQLSDGPLLKEMRGALARQDYRVGAAIETIVRSRQFREIRGREAEIAAK